MKTKAKSFEGMLRSETELNRSILCAIGHDCGIPNTCQAVSEWLELTIEEVQKGIDELVAKGKLTRYEPHDIFPDAYYDTPFTPSNY